jgi:hypothetical protein
MALQQGDRTQNVQQTFQISGNEHQHGDGKILLLMIHFIFMANSKQLKSTSTIVLRDDQELRPNTKQSCSAFSGG